MICLGFDPGITGAGCIIGLATGPVVFDLPAIDLPKGEGVTRRRLHARGLYEILIQHLAGQDNVHAVTEALSTGGKGSNASSVGSQFRTRGALEATVELVGLQLEEVYPVTWKKLYGLQGKQEDKKGATLEARQMAIRLYPDLADKLQRVMDHNRAEAVLITHWYRREVMRRRATSAVRDPFAA
jgi:hypothetical protein